MSKKEEEEVEKAKRFFKIIGGKGIFAQSKIIEIKKVREE